MGFSFIMSSPSDRRLALGMRVVYSFCFFAHLLKSLGIVMKLVTANGSIRSLWLVIFVVVECLNISYKGYVLRNLWASSSVLSPASFADFALFLGAVDIPMFNIMASMTFHSFLNNKNVYFFCYFVNCVNGLAMPPAHAFSAWMFSILPFM